MDSFYITINHKKIKVQKLKTFKEKLKGFRLQLEPIKSGICYCKKKSINTYFLCQNIDIVMTNKEHKVLYIYQNIRSEKFIFRKKKVYYIYELPAFSTKGLQIGDTLANDADFD